MAGRFYATAHAGGLTAAADRLGHVFVFGPSYELVCVFYFFRSSFAAWLPDGTRVGPHATLGGPVTPDGMKRLAQALRESAGLIDPIDPSFATETITMNPPGALW